MPTENSQDKSKTGRGELAPAKGKLGIMIPGMGAVATTFVAGVEAVRKGISSPIGSLTQMGTIRLGKRTDGRSPKVKDFVPLAGLERSGLHRLGHLRRRHVRCRRQGWRVGSFAAGAGEAVPVVDQAAQGRLRQELRQEARWPQREEGQEQEGTGRAVARGHPRVQAVVEDRAAGHDLVRIDRELHSRLVRCIRRSSRSRRACSPATRTSRRR